MLSPHARVLALATVLAFVVLTPVASAASISASESGGVADQISYTAGGGEVNNLTITRSGNTLTFADSGAEITVVGTTCTGGGPPPGTPVSCPIQPDGTIVIVALLDQSDRMDAGTVGNVYFNVSGGFGNDTLIGGASGNQLQGDDGDDPLTGGAGNDVFIGGPGRDDTVGGGQDSSTSSCGDDATYTEKTNNLSISLDEVANDDTGDGETLTGIESVTGGNGNDVLTGNDARNCLGGRDGDDILSGLGGDDDLDAEAGGDTLSGGDGDDDLDDHTEGDQAAVLSGGNGIDSASFCAYTAAPDLTARAMGVTLDDVANDGPDGNDDIRADVEDLSTCESADNVVGNAEFNVISTAFGTDTIDPGTGSDLVDAGEDDDTVNARDGFSDRVDCNEGIDTANVDQLDTVRNCETVNREARPVALEDRPPGVEFTAPGPGAGIAANTPTTLRANASDDRGVARVLFLDDDRVVCTDTAPPYDCVYQPRAEDVNRNTLAAVAVDTAEQAAFANRTVTVPRFTATRLRARTTPRRDRRRPFRFITTGRLELPPVVAPALACKGRVSIQIKTNRSTISTRRARLRPNCTYGSRVTFRVPRRLVRRRLKVIVRFGGNAIVAPRRARSYTIRTS